jgi:hypothetical protein
VGSLYELGRQVYPDTTDGDIVAERALCAERSEAAYLWLEQQPARVVSGMREFRVRCPVKGCLLGEVYRFPVDNGGARYLARTVTNRVTHVGFINWAFSDDWAGPRVWFPSACRHGQAKIERVWLDGLLALLHDWHHAMETTAQARAQYPEAEQRGRASHVPPQA